MKKKSLILVMIMAIGLILCSCGSDTAESTIQSHSPYEDEQMIASLLKQSDADVALMDYSAPAGAKSITVGYDVFTRGKLTQKNQDQLTTGVVDESKTGMIGVSLGKKDSLISVAGDDGSAGSASGENPWKKNSLKSSASAELSAPVNVEMKTKVYFFCHLENKGDEIEGITPDAIQEDPGCLKDIEKAYVYYAIFN